MPNRTVLVVEDDSAIRRGLGDALRFAGFTVREAADGQKGLELASQEDLTLVLLDVVLPKMDGFQVLEEIRRSRPSLPVIMLTARGTEEDRVQGLRNGADDYVVKPFGVRELLARVEAVLRRTPERPRNLGSISIKGRRIDFETREVHFDSGGSEELSEREAQLLHYLGTRPGHVVSRDELLQRVWGLDPRGIQTRTVDMHVVRLRERLRDDPKTPEIIVTVRARGYRFGDQS